MTERKLTMAQAIAEAIGQEMERDPRVFAMGEDIGRYGEDPGKVPPPVIVKVEPFH